MNGPFAQLVCLATYGRRWLAAPYAEWPPDPHLGNSTFRYVSSVRFRGGRLWNDVPSWLEGLRDRGAKALWLDVVTDRMPDGIGFANGDAGTWALVAKTESGQERWHARWEHLQGARDGRTWSVEYTGTGSNVAVPVPALDVAEATLRAALDESETAARDLGETGWAEWFAQARDANGAFRFHPDMVPPDFPDDRRRVAAMAEQAWVFGGMGSWNDAIGDAPVAHRLYGAILTAFAAAVNG